MFPDSKTVGKYDYLAIKYGYKEVVGEVSNEKHPDVIAIADEMASLNLEFATDEDAFLGTDQLNRRFDLTEDPVSWVNDQLKLTSKMIANADAAIAWDGSNVGYEAHGNYILSATLLSDKRLDVLINLLGGRTLNKQYPSAPPPIKVTSKPQCA